MKYLVAIALLVATVLGLNLSSPTPATSQNNPNGSSELSTLMRDMQQYTNRAKEGLKSGAKPEPYPAKFDKIHTAKITEGMSKSDYYKSFADLYVMSVKNYAKSTKADRVETWSLHAWHAIHNIALARCRLSRK
jgi:hypothetical protein